MKPFFDTPSEWEGCPKVIQFKGSRNLQAGKGVPERDQKNKKRKQKKGKAKIKTSNETSAWRHEPLAPQSDDDDAIDEDNRLVTATKIHKIKSGRIEKQKMTKKQQKLLSPALVKASIESMAVDDDATNNSPTSALATKLKAELLGGRFRFLNEQLYTLNSCKAQNLFKQDRDAFAAYHEGYRHQVARWPINPLQRIIKTIKRLPKTHEIGDFGCGEGMLAQSVPNKVYSMDLVSTRSDIIACDIANTPLQPQSLDVAVYCLSLMGTNLNEFFLEANRVLKLHGMVYISEIQSRFEDVRLFVRAMGACGFDLVKKDVAANYFYFFQFKKMRHVGKVAKLLPFSLKPCLYRKR